MHFWLLAKKLNFSKLSSSRKNNLRILTSFNSVFLLHQSTVRQFSRRIWSWVPTAWTGAQCRSVNELEWRADGEFPPIVISHAGPQMCVNPAPKYKAFNFLRTKHALSQAKIHDFFQCEVWSLWKPCERVTSAVFDNTCSPLGSYKEWTLQPHRLVLWHSCISRYVGLHTYTQCIQIIIINTLPCYWAARAVKTFKVFWRNAPANVNDWVNGKIYLHDSYLGNTFLSSVHNKVQVSFVSYSEIIRFAH